MRKINFISPLEALAFIVVIGLGALIIYQQFISLSSVANDKERKADINAIHYNLEEIYFKDNKNYPLSISRDNLTALDNEALTDPEGYRIDDPGSSYHYEPLGCSESKCDSYYLYADLENEPRYEKRPASYVTSVNPL